MQNQNDPAPAPMPPPPAAPQTSTYRYEPYGFEFQYSSDLNFTQPTYANLDEKIVELKLPASAYPGTNFADAAFSVSAQSMASENMCRTNENFANIAAFVRVADINGAVVYRAEASDAAAGNRYESRVFRTYRDSRCFELLETIHTGNIGNYPEGSVKEVDRSPIWAKLDMMLNSFKFTK
jgi:hypothetical protein